MGTFGAGPFSNDSALDLLDELPDHPTSQRRKVLMRIFFRNQDRPELLGWTLFRDEIVAAAAVVAASPPGGVDIPCDLADQATTSTRCSSPAPHPELNASALKALLVAAGQDGPWHDGWADSVTAAPARQTTDRLAVISCARSTHRIRNCRCNVK